MYVTVYMYTVRGLGTCLQVVTVIVLKCRPVTDMPQSQVTEDDETPEDGDAVFDDEEDVWL